MTTEWWWLEGSRRSPRRDSREDDPEWYRSVFSGEWVERTAWSADAFPQDREECMRYIQETTSLQRDAILTERKRREGLVRWNSSWVTPERAEELEANFQKGLQRDRKALWEAQQRAHRYRVFWC